MTDWAARVEGAEELQGSRVNIELEKQVEALFHELAELTSAQRERRFHERCGDVPELRPRVERLLALHDAGCDPGLRTPVFVNPSESLPPLPTPLPKRIGRYEIVRLVGEGGMSTVYEAIQDRPHRSVAVKVVRNAVVSETTRRRLQFEAEVLGQLQHPAIAQIYEAGMAEFEVAGGVIQQPFLAMEYVAGRSITAYAAGRNLGVGDRLELLARVCDAVQYAHHKGVIHRDLKPANIMVRESDDMSTVGGSAASPGQPVVLDFGIALVLAADLAAQRLKTGEGQILGTLAYMSPEQVRGDPAQVDTRSDVYALGVILYELLAGRLPHDVAEVPILQAMNRICEAAPIHIRAIAPGLGREIEAICAKALHKEKTRRYQSAADLADDIRRFLRKEPIEARSDSTLYMLSKNVQRYRVPITAVCLFVVALIGFAIYADIQAKHFSFVAQREQQARTDAEGQRRIAEQQATRATAVVELLREMIGSADPQQVKGRDYTVRQLLDDFDVRQGSQFFNQPDVEATVRTTIGTAYRGLAEFDKADAQLTKALRISRESFGEVHSEVARVLEELAWLRYLQARYDEGMDLCQQALEMHRQLLGPEHPQIARNLDQWASFQQNAGRFEEAEENYRNALAMRRRLLGDDHLDVSESLHNLAVLQQHRGLFGAAEPLYRESLLIRRRVLGDVHPLVAQTTIDFASLLKERGHDGEAEQLFREALSINRTVYGNSHPEVAWSLAGLGTVLRVRAKFTEAEQSYREALGIWDQTHGRSHPGYGVIAKNLANLLRDLGRLSEAESLLDEALASLRILGDAHPTLARGLSDLAAVRREQGRFEESERIYREALAMIRAVYPGEHPLYCEMSAGLAETLTEQGRCMEAIPMLQEVVEQSKRLHGTSHRLTLSAMAKLSEAFTAAAMYKEGAASAENALAIAGSALEPNDLVFADLKLALARSLSGGDDPADSATATELVRQAISLRTLILPPGHWRIGEARIELGHCLVKVGQVSQAEAEYGKGLEILQSALGQDHNRTRRASWTRAEGSQWP